MTDERNLTHEQATAVFDDAPCGIGVFTELTDAPLFLNKAYYELVGYTKEAYQNQIGNDHKKLIFSEDIPLFVQYNKRFYETRTIKNLQYRIVRADGSIRWVKLNISDVLFAGKNASLCYFLDMTSEKNAATQLELVSDNIGDSISVFNVKNGKEVLVYANDNFYKLAGYRREDYRHNPHEHNMRFLNTGDRQNIKNAVKESLGTGKVIEVIYSFLGADNRFHWLRRRLKAIPQGENNDFTLISVTQDISEKKNKELKRAKEAQAFDELERKLSSDQNKLISIFKFNLTKDTVVSAQRKGMSFADLTQFSGINSYSKQYGPQVFENQMEFMKIFSRENFLQTEASGESISHVYQRYSDTGDIIWAKTRVIFSTSPYTGDKIALLYTFDITEEKTVQIAMRKVSESNFDFVFIIDVKKDQIIQAIFNTKLKEEYKNRLKTRYQGKPIGYSNYTTEFFNCYCKEAPEEAIAANSAGVLIEKLEENDTYSNIVKLIRPLSNTPQYLLYRYTYLDETKAKVLATRTDITDSYLKEKQVQAELSMALQRANEANKAKTAFLSAVSHDMRTPLNGILGLTELMLDSISEPRLREDLMQVKNSGHYLLNLINDTLDVNKIESGSLALSPTICEGKEVIKSVLKLAQPNLRAKDIDLKLEIKPLPYTTLFIDIGRIEQVVLNVLGNAIKFSPKGGSIELTMENISVENNIITDRIIIRDHGIGMSKAFLNHIFEPFRQEHQHNKTKYQGTGLGMSITKQILDLMGGEIFVESTQGVGTAVTFTLPMPIATREQIMEAKQKDAIHESDAELRGKRVLLCEDHLLNITITTRLLDRIGVLVDVAENGEIGYQKFISSENGYYDAILMDIRMPVMDGLQATRAIRSAEHPQALTIPIIASTANAFDSDVEEARNAGMNAHISKPIIPEKLYAVLAEELQKASTKGMFSFLDTKRKQKVLVVDDMEVNRAVMEAALNEEYDVLTAGSGTATLQILKDTKDIAAVITDIQMPTMSGVELIRTIRRDSSYDRVALIANTQYGDPNQEESLLLCGADDFVYKPTKPAVITARLQNVLLKYGK